MPNTGRGFPYPLSTDPVAQGAANIQALAEAVDARVPSSAAALPAAPYDGQIVRLALTAASYVQLTYHAATGQWSSAPVNLPLMRDPQTVITQTDVNAYTELATSYADHRRAWRAFTDVGLALQVRFSLIFGCTINNVAYYVRPTIHGINYGAGGWQAAQPITVCEQILASGDPSALQFRDTGWKDVAGLTVHDYYHFRAQGMRATGGTGKAGQYADMEIQTRWVKTATATLLPALPDGSEPPELELLPELPEPELLPAEDE